MYSVTVTAVTVAPGPATILFTVQTREDGRLYIDPVKNSVYNAV